MNLFTNRWVVLLTVMPFLGIAILHLSFSMIWTWEGAFGILGFLLFILRFKENFLRGKKGLTPAKRNFLMCIALYAFTMIFSGIWNGNISLGILYTYSFYIGSYLLIDICTDNFDEVIKGLAYLFAFVIIGSYLYGIVSPAGARRSYGGQVSYVGLLNSKNGVQMIMIPACCFLCIYIYYFKGRYKYFFVLLIILAMILMYLSGSATATIMTLILPVYLIICKKFKPSFKLLATIYVVIYFSVIIFRLQEVFLYDFITETLGKDITLSDRTNIWDVVLSSITSSPIIGFGPRNTIIASKFFRIGEAHNGFLEILVSGGGLAVSIFITIICIAGHELDKYKDNDIANILMFFLFMYCMGGLTESVFGMAKILFWLIIIISINISSVIEQSKKIEELKT